MARPKLHPALAWEREQIARAAYFTATQYIGRGYDRREARTLADAIAIAKTMPAAMGGVLIYAVTPDGHDPYVTTVWPDARTTKPEETIMTDIVATNGKAPKRRQGKKAKRPSKAKATPPAAPREAKEPKALAQGKIYQLKRLVFDNPEISVDDLDAALVKQGFPSAKSVAASFKTDFIHSLRLLVELGVIVWPPQK